MANPDSIRGEKPSLDKKVAIPAVLLVAAVLLWGLLSPESFSAFAADALSEVVADFGWLFVLSSTIFVFFIVAVGASRFGHIRLGKDDEEPEFSTPSWIAMMFAAGMGIGLMFYGVTEPLTHYRSGVPDHDKHDVSAAFATTLFHWTLHPWAVYSIVGLSIAYGTFRLGRKQLISSSFIPLIGVRRAEGGLGKAIDVLSIFATVFGTAASLGLGALQIGAGMSKVGLVDEPKTWIYVLIVVVLGACFLLSAASGVGKGIQYISNANMVMAALLAIFVLLLGPTLVILNMVPTAMGSYFAQFFEMAARTADSDNGNAGDWLGSWTIFYWAWWISWSPFVGMFLARISRGRTIREFVFTVMLVPTVISVVWFAIFGGSAMHYEQIGESVWGEGEATSQLFDLLSKLPISTPVSVLAMILLSTFFITSADSASTVMGSMSQNGAIEASRKVTVMWGLLTAGIGIVLMVSGGADALSNLQSVTIIAASPFVIIIIALMFSLVKGLSEDPMNLDHKAQRKMALKLAREQRLQEAAARRRSRAKRPREGALHGEKDASESEGSEARDFEDKPYDRKVDIVKGDAPND